MYIKIYVYKDKCRAQISLKYMIQPLLLVKSQDALPCFRAIKYMNGPLGGSEPLCVRKFPSIPPVVNTRYDGMV